MHGLHRPSLAVILFVLAFAPACSVLRSEGRALDADELAGTDRMLAITRAWGDQDERVRPVAEALDETRAKGRFFRSRVARPSIMAVTRGDEIHFADRTKLRVTEQDERLIDAYSAINVLVHEGWHLTQSRLYRVVGRAEEQAYRETQVFERWLLGGWLDGDPKIRAFLPAPDLAAYGRAMRDVRMRTGGGFLDDIDPVHRITFAFEDYRKRLGPGPEPVRGHLHQRWPLRRTRLRISARGVGRLPLPATDEASTIVIQLRHPEFARMPATLSLVDIGGHPDRRIGWFLVRDRTTGVDLTDVFNRCDMTIERDDAVRSAPRLKIAGDLPPGDYDVVWAPHHFRAVGTPTPYTPEP